MGTVTSFFAGIRRVGFEICTQEPMLWSDAPRASGSNSIRAGRGVAPLFVIERTVTEVDPGEREREIMEGWMEREEKDVSAPNTGAETVIAKNRIVKNMYLFIFIVLLSLTKKGSQNMSEAISWLDSFVRSFLVRSI